MKVSLTAALLLFGLVPEDPAMRQKREELEAHEKEMAAVWLTTDRELVKGCANLGGIGFSHDNSLDHLRRSAARLGADVVRLRSLRDDGLFAEVYRCAEWDPSNLPTPTRTPTDQQKASRKSFEEMKSRVRVVEEPSLVAGCEKRTERSVNLLDGGEDTLRGAAVAGRANVVVLRRFEGTLAIGEIYFCPISEFRALPSPTPAGKPTPGR